MRPKKIIIIEINSNIILIIETLFLDMSNATFYYYTHVLILYILYRINI